MAQSPESLVRLALSKRDAVKSAESQLKAARSSAASLGAYPTTRLETGTGTRPDVSGGEDLTLFQPLDIFGKSRAAGRSAHALVRVSEANLRQAKLSVQTEVLSSYAVWASASRNHRFALDQLEIVRKVEAATKSRVEAKALPELQSARAALEVRRAEQVVIDREAALQVATVKLRQVVGDEVPGLGESEPEALATEVLRPANAERDRPELAVLLSQRQGFQSDFQQARLSRLPDLELQARRSPWSSDTEQYGLRLQLVFPLWDHGAARKRADAASQQAEATSLDYSDTLKRVLAEVESARIQLSASQGSLLAYAKLLEGAQDLLRRTQRGFELGANTLLDVLDAKRALDDALEQSSNARQNADLAVGAALAAQGQILGENPR
jgi:outer membrane protein TolC